MLKYVLFLSGKTIGGRPVMGHIANLATAEGDAMQIRFQYKTAWGYGGYMGRTMAGRESSYDYAGDIEVLARLSAQRERPDKILCEMSTTYKTIYGGMNETASEQQQYELKFIGDRSYLATTENKIVICSIFASDFRRYSNNQYVTFTLVYGNNTVPLIDPINGSPVFQINLESAFKAGNTTEKSGVSNGVD
jgi:hypothetical protein